MGNRVKSLRRLTRALRELCTTTRLLSCILMHLVLCSVTRRKGLRRDTPTASSKTGRGGRRLSLGSVMCW